MYEVNRSMLLVIPAEPFWRWVVSLQIPGLEAITLEDLQADPNAYLINPCDDLDEAWDQLEERMEEIFSAELADWCEQTDSWPDLHIDIFAEWFEIRLSTIVSDLGRAELEREPFEPLVLGN